VKRHGLTEVSRHAFLVSLNAIQSFEILQVSYKTGELQDAPHENQGVSVGGEEAV
jgi:hypothetical protein